MPRYSFAPLGPDYPAAVPVAHFVSAVLTMAAATINATTGVTSLALWGPITRSTNRKQAIAMEQLKPDLPKRQDLGKRADQVIHVPSFLQAELHRLGHGDLLGQDLLAWQAGILGVGDKLAESLGELLRGHSGCSGELLADRPC